MAADTIVVVLFVSALAGHLAAIALLHLCTKETKRRRRALLGLTALLSLLGGEIAFWTLLSEGLAW